jgi:hypothetical protein
VTTGIIDDQLDPGITTKDLVLHPDSG